MRVVTSPDPDVYSSTENYQPLVLALVDKNSEILSLLQAVVIRQVRYLGRLASRLVIQGAL